MAEFTESQELRDLAEQLISNREEVAHIDINDVLFLREYQTRPGKGQIMAMTYRLDNHPIQLFSGCRFAIVFYDNNCSYMSWNQMKILMYHELLHIPENPLLIKGLIPHSVQDFGRVLSIDLNWAKAGRDVPDILEGGSDGQSNPDDYGFDTTEKETIRSVNES
jgi:hypothetical protein